MRCAAPISVLLALTLLAGCNEKGAPDAEQEAPAPPSLTASARPQQPAQGAEQGTPLKDRVATLGLLNKRNNLSQDIELKPGESKRVGDVIVRLASCERTPPWEEPEETGAFVQVLVAQGRNNADTNANGNWEKIFSGWLFKNSPSVNVVEHPIYDVWVKNCAMRFPGEEAAPSDGPSPDASDNSAA
ncbi:DUF2155 domain-containing protein [Erythrobacter sp. 3-20A1M]|uniref:DUF2155 domain-containing protein n=1 Tax=Erythrobacter sp. 3-20A1M TaxID=2653850 RepID=UPI001BFC3071|nr:DUF2155 domain-containing protein [Erythrobacter sp. 3-20A1M]QWC56508.1 DUF2155 domain-containing protein [Erythrobacter sp. 3-20A1M]